MSIRINDALRIRTTEARTTPAPTADRFRDALAEGASQVLAGVEQAAGLVPGGSVITAAVRAGRGGGSGVGSNGAGSAGSAEAPGAGSGPQSAGGMQGALADSASQSMQLLELQQQIAMEQRQFTTVSNVMKARHDTAKSVINNVR